MTTSRTAKHKPAISLLSDQTLFRENEVRTGQVAPEPVHEGHRIFAFVIEVDDHDIGRPFGCRCEQLGAFQEVVRDHFDEFRACYEGGIVTVEYPMQMARELGAYPPTARLMATVFLDQVLRFEIAVDGADVVSRSGVVGSNSVIRRAGFGFSIREHSAPVEAQG